MTTSIATASKPPLRGFLPADFKDEAAPLHVRKESFIVSLVREDADAHYTHQGSYGLPTCTNTGSVTFVNSLDGHGPVLIREEYDNAWKWLQEMYEEHVKEQESTTQKRGPESQAYVIWGQSSAGKTVYASLLRARLIAKNQSMLYTQGDEWYYYDGNNQYLWWMNRAEVPTESELGLFFRHQSRLWITYDSHDLDLDKGRDIWCGTFGKTSLYKAFLDGTSHPFVVFTSSPIKDRWDLIQHWKHAVKYWMNPWTEEELKATIQARQTYRTNPWQSVAKKHCDQAAEASHYSTVSLRKIFDTDQSRRTLSTYPEQAALQEFYDWGPLPHLQLDPSDSQVYEEWKRTVGITLRDCNLSKLANIYGRVHMGAGSKEAQMVFHKIYVHRTQSHSDPLPRTRIEGQEIRRIISTKMVPSMMDKANDVENFLCVRDYFVKTAGLSFELRARWFLLHGDQELRLQQMQILEHKKQQLTCTGHIQPLNTPNNAKLFQSDSKTSMESGYWYFPETNYPGIDCLYMEGQQLFLFSITQTPWHDIRPVVYKKLLHNFHDINDIDFTNWNLVFLVPKDNIIIQDQSKEFQEAKKWLLEVEEKRLLFPWELSYGVSMIC
ncbi:MAG: hypothetical protein Q9165_003982 [Trypethelium subeluteriae]